MSANASLNSAPAVTPSSDLNRELFDQVMAPNYAPIDLIPERGEGCRLWDVEGKEYLDFAAGIAVSALGHAHPALCRALTAQAEKFWHVSNVLTNKPALELAQKLCRLTFAERVFFANSGAEANEAALKLARRFAFDHHGEQKSEIIAFDNGFHGRTFFTVCVGGQPKYSDGFGPKPADITHLPFNDVAALEKAVSDRTCAVILEPMQGEGGLHPATAEFASAARKLCDKHNALLIFDEIQTGVGRSGKLFLHERLGVLPDIMTSAKGLGGGFPISAMLTTETIADSLKLGTHGSTYGGNPMGCAVASTLLDIVSEPDLLASVGEKSNLMFSLLAELNSELQCFSDIRGVGLLIGCELAGSLENRASDVVRICMDQGLLALQAGPGVLRLAPPLIISDDEIITGIETLKRAISQA